MDARKKLSEAMDIMDNHYPYLYTHITQRSEVILNPDEKAPPVSKVLFMGEEAYALGREFVESRSCSELAFDLARIVTLEQTPELEPGGYQKDKWNKAKQLAGRLLLEQHGVRPVSEYADEEYDYYYPRIKGASDETGSFSWVGKYAHTSENIYKILEDDEEDKSEEEGGGEGEGEGGSSEGEQPTSPSLDPVITSSVEEMRTKDNGTKINTNKLISWLDPEIIAGYGIRSRPDWRFQRKGLHHMRGSVLLPAQRSGSEDYESLGGKKSYAVCCDWSGSVDEESKDAFLKIIRSLAKTNHDIVFVFCASRYKVYSKADVLKSLKDGSKKFVTGSGISLGSGNGYTPDMGDWVCEGYQAALGVNNAVDSGLLSKYPERILFITDGQCHIPEVTIPEGSAKNWKIVVDDKYGLMNHYSKNCVVRKNHGKTNAIIIKAFEDTMPEMATTIGKTLSVIG